MTAPGSNLVNTVWNHGDYVEQLTGLLFLKMDYECTRPPYKKTGIPEEYNSLSRSTAGGRRHAAAEGCATGVG